MNQRLIELYVDTAYNLGFGLMWAAALIIGILIWLAVLNQVAKLFRVHKAIIEFIVHRKAFKEWKKSRGMAESADISAL